MLRFLCPFIAVIAATAAGAAGELTDGAVSDAVEDRIGQDPAILCEAIDVSAANGLVTLSGRVDCLPCRQRAGAAAETVRGVRAVINRIQVAPPSSRSDESVLRDVERMLLYDAATAERGIKANITRGVVTLTGTVNTWQEKQLAEAVVSNILGLIEVKNAVQLRPQAPREDDQIEAEIRQALRWDVLVDHGLIEANVHKGLVRLSGVVASAAEWTRARNDALVAGAEMVDASALEVQRWTRDKELRRGKHIGVGAPQLEAAIRDALAKDPRVAPFNVSAELGDSGLVLRGVVNNILARRSAEWTVRTVVGAGRVINRLKVRPAEPVEDAVLATNIRQALHRDPYLSALQIQVTVEGGLARLTGSADTYFQKARAEDVVSMARGIIAVRNQLEVPPHAGPFVSNPYIDAGNALDYAWYDPQPRLVLRQDDVIRAAIGETMRWCPYVNADAVQVDMRNGAATLTGTVGCEAQKQAAARNAYAGGATWVVNELKVEVETTRPAMAEKN